MPSRELRYDIGEKKYEDLPDGGLLIRDVTLLAEGVWTDSAVRTPLRYNSDVLERHATNWSVSTVWSRHNLGISRDVVSDKIGEVKDQKYDPERKAIVGDVWLHGHNAKSRDAIEMYKAGLVRYASVEHGGDEEYNPDDNTFVAKSLEFYGVALVEKGACAKCFLEEPNMTKEEKPKEEPQETEETPDFTRALEPTNELIRTLGETIKTMKEEFKTSLEELEKKVRNLEEQEEEPVTDNTEKTETDSEPRELEEPKVRIHHDKNGRMRMV